MSADVTPLVTLLLLVVVFWLLAVRPAKRRQQQHQRLISAVAVGQRVVMAAGLHGTVHALTETEVQVEVAPGVVLTFERGAILRTVA